MIASGCSSISSGPLSPSTRTGTTAPRPRRPPTRWPVRRRRRCCRTRPERPRAGQPGGLRGDGGHVSSFREGNGSRRASGLLTLGAPLLRRLPGRRGQWHFGEASRLLTAAGPCRTRTGFLDRSPSCRAEHTAWLGWRPVVAARLNLWLPVVLWAALILQGSRRSSASARGFRTWTLSCESSPTQSSSGCSAPCSSGRSGASRSRSSSAPPTPSPTRCTRRSSPAGRARRSTGWSTRSASSSAFSLHSRLSVARMKAVAVDLEALGATPALARLPR